MEKSTHRFEFKTAGGLDQPAIWFLLQEKEVFIFPLELYGILWECRMKHRISRDIAGSFLILRDEVFGTYYDDSCGTYQIEHDRNAFIDSAFKALKDLCDHVIKNGTCMYRNFTAETAECLLLGLGCLSIPENCFQIFFDEISIEDFSFRFIEPYSCDTAYEIRIGRRSYISNISDWTTDFNQLRNEIEAFALSAWTKKEIHLNFEGSPTILRLDAISLFPTNISHPEVVRLTVLPDAFSKQPITFGWCRPRQIICTLYLGLLELFTSDTDWFDDGSAVTWDTFRLRAYNHVQSCIIENYISETAESEQAYSYRNRIVHSVEEMLDDFEKLRTMLMIQ